MLMTAAVCHIKPTHILEWGTNIGVSARIFHEICRAFSLTSEIHSIDLPDHEYHQEHPGKNRGRLVHGISNVKLYQGDGLKEAQKILASASVAARPLFFLDGDHEYDTVFHELVTIVRNVPTASILVHDTFYQSNESGYNIGPYLAVQDALKDTCADFDIVSQNYGLPGMIFLWRRA
jgi:cephalosporin hydroxylase